MALQFHQLGDLGIRAGQRAAHDELGVAVGELLQKLADDPANGVVGGGYAKEDLRGAGILLREPASQAILRGGVAAFEGLEQGDGGLRGKGGGLRDALVQRETPGDEPLPECQGEAQQGECAENEVQDHC